MTVDTQQHDDELPLFATPAPPIDTRAASAERIAPKIPKLRAKVLTFIAGCGDDGATDFEIADGLGMLESTARARRVELRDSGLVVDSGQRRSTPSKRPAVVWTAVADLETADLTRLASPSKKRKMTCPWCGR